MRHRWRRLLAGAAGLALTATVAGYAWVRTVELPPLEAPLSVSVLDREGALLRVFTTPDGRWRLPVAEVDPDYIAQLIAYEDKRFYSHPGVDPIALARAVLDAITTGEIRSGGSTLTMQVARLLEAGTTGRWQGKLRQIRVALALEMRLSKQEILDIYLTRAPFGGNLEGVRAASLSYFGKEPRRLTTAEAAILVALPQAPEARRPDRATQATLKAARARVLDRARDAGVIDADTHARAARAELPDRRRPMPALSPHLAERLVRAAPDTLFHPTTLDADLQQALETLASNHAKAHPAPGLSAALIVADHRTGEILARVGAADYFSDARAGFVDMTTALRSPGSTLKPLIYALAFELGIAHPETLIEDRPMRFGAWRPGNFDKAFHGWVPVRTALQTSLNIPAVALLERVGPAVLTSRMGRVGVEPVTPDGAQPGLPIALGGAGLRLQDLVQLYATLAAGGDAARLHQAPGSDTRTAPLISPVSAAYLREILRGDRSGRIAIKTGTSYGYRDAWAIGYDGAHVIGVWLGRADGAAVPGLTGQGVAVPLLRQAFQRLSPALTPFPPIPPGALTVNRSQLPKPLQRFTRGPGRGQDNALRIAFPPEGAILDLGLGRGNEGQLVVKLENGRPPFVWLMNGAVAAASVHRPEFVWPVTAPGFHTVTVIDADGETVSQRLTLE